MSYQNLMNLFNMKFEDLLTLSMKFWISMHLWTVTFWGANQGEFMTKELNKAIMTRTRLLNKDHKEKSADSNIAR